MKSTLFTACLLFVGDIALAQVPKKTIVEHFTNTRCSVCASRNPGFYNNLKQQSGTLHLAIHPSSPYNGCLLHKQNATENDARTNFYGIYGGTPRLVINGEVVTVESDYSSDGIFVPFHQLTSPAAITIRQTKYNSDSIRVTVVVKTVASHTLGALSLFTALAEDTVFYTGSNGESTHFDVFRKSLGSTSGINVALPANIGDSVVYTATTTANPVWNFNRINTYVILQESSNKKLVQSEKYGSPVLITGTEKVAYLKESRGVYPNPGKGIFFIENTLPGSDVEVHTLQGVLVKKIKSMGKISELNITGNNPGIYLVTFTVYNNHTVTQKLILTGD